MPFLNCRQFYMDCNEEKETTMKTKVTLALALIATATGWFRYKRENDEVWELLALMEKVGDSYLRELKDFDYGSQLLADVGTEARKRNLSRRAVAEMTLEAMFTHDRQSNTET